MAAPAREPLCECCDLPVSSCGKAAEDRQRAQDRRHRTWLVGQGWFASSYPGSCDNCGTPFKAGKLIHANGRGGMRWRSECCAPDMPEGTS